MIKSLHKTKTWLIGWLVGWLVLKISDKLSALKKYGIGNIVYKPKFFLLRKKDALSSKTNKKRENLSPEICVYMNDFKTCV